MNTLELELRKLIRQHFLSAPIHDGSNPTEAEVQGYEDSQIRFLASVLNKEYLQSAGDEDASD